MKTIRARWACLITAVAFGASPGFAGDPAPADSGKIRVLVVTGGHGFEKAPFFKLFENNADIRFQAVEHPKAHALFKTEAAKAYDVVVEYDFNQTITEEAKADFLALLHHGKGLVVLHHAISSYPKWPEYWKIIGARYYLEKTVVDGVEKARSAYKHDMDFKIHVADPEHPVTRGVQDYAIHDETYKWFDVASDCHPLLTTDEPESNRVVAWAKTYDASRVVVIQSGHDHFAYENPNFQRILRQAIRWTAETSRGGKLLFDGKTTRGWHSFKKTSFPEAGWVVEDGWLHCLGKHGGDIVSDEQFEQFDLQWEWKLARVGNSGVKYFVADSRNSALGHEYQMLDDERNPDGRAGEGKRLTGAFYDVLKPSGKTPVREPGEINQSRVLVQGNHVEHWLNGVKVLEYECGSEAVKKAVGEGKFRNTPGFGERLKGHILLQDHNYEVWFRNVRLRDLSGG